MPSVLLIDSDAPSVKLERLLLEEVGFRVTSVPTLEAARAVLAHKSPVLVVTELPRTNVSAHISSLRGAALDTPIVAVTSRSGSSVEFRALEAGCSGFIRKPIDVVTFATQLLTFAGDRR